MKSIKELNEEYETKGKAILVHAGKLCGVIYE